jgi:hypothetical protein
VPGVGKKQGFPADLLTGNGLAGCRGGRDELDDGLAVSVLIELGAAGK